MTDFTALVQRIVADASTDACTLHADVLALAEKPLLEAVLEVNGGNLTWTAHDLGIHRNTLRELMRKHGIPAVPQPVGPGRSYMGPRPSFA